MVVLYVGMDVDSEQYIKRLERLCSYDKGTWKVYTDQAVPFPHDSSPRLEGARKIAGFSGHFHKGGVGDGQGKMILSQ